MTRHGSNRAFYVQWDAPTFPAPKVPLTREERVRELAERLSRLYQHAAIRGDMWPDVAEAVRIINEARLWEGTHDAS